MDLELIRRRHKWLTLTILVFIGAVFIFGMGSFVTDFGLYSTGVRGVAAEVNGEEISMNEYVLERDNMRRQFSQSGQELPQTAIDIINMRALNQLIDFKLLAQKAKEIGLMVTDEEFNNAIHSDPTFQVDGKFVGAEGYRNFIEQGLKMNVTDFENFYRDRLLAQKLGLFIGETVMVTDQKLLNKYNLQNEKANLYYIKFSASDFQNREDPTDEEIDRYYQRKKADFQTDELRTIRYIVLEPETFENSIEISDEELQAYYNAYPEEFQSEDGATLSFDEAKADVESNLKSQRAEATSREFLDNFGISADTDKTLDQIAQDHGVSSINDSSPFTRTQTTGSMPPVVVNKAYSMQQDSLAIVPVGTSTWVVELKNISEPREKTIEEARQEIVAALNDQKSKNQARQKANKALASLRSAKKDQIKDKAKEQGYELKETGAFTRVDRIPEINLEEVKSEVFELDQEGATLSRVYDNNNDYYVLILKERIDADQEEFESAKEDLMQQELQTQRTEVLQKWLQNLRREANIEPNSNLFPAQG